MGRTFKGPFKYAGKGPSCETRAFYFFPFSEIFY